MTKWANIETTKKVVCSSLKIFNVSRVNRAVLEEALQLYFSDFEDAVLHQSAFHANLNRIVNRNKKDFSKASLLIYTPTELIALYSFFHKVYLYLHNKITALISYSVFIRNGGILSQIKHY